MTEDQQERIREERLALHHMRCQARKDKSLPTRLREAIDQARMLSTAKAGQIGTDTARQKAQSKEPPAAEEIHIADRLAHIEHAIELLEEVVDSERGLSPARDFKTLTTSELDQELKKWVGVPSWVVAARAPYLGRTPRTIERARQRLGVRQKDGRPLEDRKAA
jgi:uncharacterized protein (DUF1501 family)